MSESGEGRTGRGSERGREREREVEEAKTERTRGEERREQICREKGWRRVARGLREGEAE